jgi:hypothetical protein
VIRRSSEEGGASVQVHEVYYDEHGAIEGWTADPVTPMGESVAELREDIRYFLSAFRQTPLEEIQVDGRAVLKSCDEALEINPGHCPEALDRAWVAQDFCYEYLGSHPVIRRDPALYALYERASDALGQLYQAIGQLSGEVV